MSHTLLSVSLRAADLPAVRAQTRKVGVLSGLEALQQTRFSTAVSEIARNAIQHAGGGVVSFVLEEVGPARQQALVALVTDQGRGITDPAAAVNGLADARGRIAMGIVGARRLVDGLSVEAPATGGTVVRLEMLLPRTASPLTPDRIASIASELARRDRLSPIEEVEHQNRELLKIHQELREKQAELERADERKNQFVATLAHELRGPLGTLKLALELMRRRPAADAQEQTRRRELMERQTKHLSDMVEELMDTAQITQGKVTLVKEPADLNALVTQSVEMSEGSIAAKGHVVTLQVGDQPLWASVDQRRLKQVFCNLIQNSARYTAPQGAITITLSASGNTGLVEIRDNGRGIAPDLLPHIFGLFVQGEQATPGEGGLGVGLALARRLVQDHDGTILAHSNGPGQGSVFTVALPLIAAPPQSAGHTVSP